MAYTGKYHSIPSFIIIGSFKVNKLNIILFCQLVSIFDKKLFSRQLARHLVMVYMKVLTGSLGNFKMLDRLFKWRSNINSGSTTWVTSSVGIRSSDNAKVTYLVTTGFKLHFKLLIHSQNTCFLLYILYNL